MSPVAIALVHHPVLDRQGAIITTAITNLDLHDLARSACTHGVGSVFIVHPVAAQRELALRIKNHWVNGSGARRIPSREPAMALLSVVETIEEAYGALGGRESIDTYVTSAKSDHRNTSTYTAARGRMMDTNRKSLILFGTGWGLAPAILDQADVFLAPLKGAHPDGYNHLSVRAACAIVLDRLLAVRE
jgi:hypothetical protein